MSDRGIQACVDELAEQLGRAVVVDDTDVHLVSASRHFGDEDQQRIRAVLQRDVGHEARRHILNQGVLSWTEPGVIPAEPTLGMAARLCMPVRHRGSLLGLILVIDASGSLTSEEISMTQKAAGEIGDVLFAASSGSNELRVEREGAVQSLLDPDLATRQHGLSYFRQAGSLATTRPAVVVAVQILRMPQSLPGTAAAALRAVCASSIPSREPTMCFEGEVAYLVQAVEAEALANAARLRADRIISEVEDLLGSGTLCVAGIGEVVSDLDHAWFSRYQSDIALTAAARVTSFGHIAAFDDLGAYAFILQQPLQDEKQLPRSISQLLRDDEHGWLVDTLESYLDHAGSAPRTAAALHIHRTSLYYRLDRIRESTGLDLDNGENRLTLHLGIRLLRLVQSNAACDERPSSAQMRSAVDVQRRAR